MASKTILGILFFVASTCGATTWEDDDWARASVYFCDWQQSRGEMNCTREAYDSIGTADGYGEFNSYALKRSKQDADWKMVSGDFCDWQLQRKQTDCSRAAYEALPPDSAFVRLVNERMQAFFHAEDRFCTWLRSHVGLTPAKIRLGEGRDCVERDFRSRKDEWLRSMNIQQLCYARADIDNIVDPELKRRGAFTPAEWKRILDGGTVRIGDRERVLWCSWGQPEDVNSTVTATHVHKQYVYSSTYFYIENGVVTAFQD